MAASSHRKMPLLSQIISSFAILPLFLQGVAGDGTGMIGYGKTLYDPPCTFACRNVLRKQTLSCTPKSSTANHGTVHNPVSTPPGCFVQDVTFLKTMALCIDVYCSLSDSPSSEKLNDYWISHLGTGTLGDYQYAPVMSYGDALQAAREDERAAATSNMAHSPPSKVPAGLTPYDVSSPLGVTVGGSSALNRTRLVDPVQWQLNYNYLSDFEINEKGHTTMTLIIAIVAICLPILLSMLRFIPALTTSSAWAHIQSIMVEPALFGRHHREQVAGIAVPNRGHTLYILLISFLNIILLLAPYTITQPQTSFTSLSKQTTSIVGNRAGTMAMGNLVALVVFSSRNSFLLYLTNWSYGTYLLLHRWLGYWTIAHTIIHSCMLWAYYAKGGTYAVELARLYWQWGIVGTIAACAILPFSLPIVRRRLYEFFIVSHIVLSLLFLVGYYYHIWYVYEYKWGYEIWMFIAAGIWALDRLLRLVRMGMQGSRTATITVIPDTDDEYLRIEVEGKSYGSGVAYLCFPTSSWRFWESHPFSICGTWPTTSGREPDDATTNSSSPTMSATDVKGEKQFDTTCSAVDTSSSQSKSIHTAFFARTQTGVTKILKDKALAINGVLRARVLIEGPYNHSGQHGSELPRYNSILCIAGGVGITACLPFLRNSEAAAGRLFWSSRKSGLITDMAPLLRSLPTSITTETLVGQRMNLDAIISRELLGADNVDLGPVAIVVCGPPGMADDVRMTVTRLARSGERCRPYVLIDEAFSW